MSEIKRIPLHSVSNTRDLGGFPAIDNRHIRNKRLIRSGQLYQLCKEDQQILLEEYHLKAVIDFRTQTEQKERPDTRMSGVTYYDNPILENVTAGITHEQNAEQISIKEMAFTMKSHGIDPSTYMMRMYQNIITNEYSLKQYKNFFDLLTLPRDGSILWHCSAGKDRVGTGTAILLYILGVDKELIINDYLQTAVFLESDIASMISQIYPNSDAPAEAIESFQACMGVKKEYISTIFDTMNRTAGSIDSFLSEKLGLNKEKRMLLQTLYLE